MGVVLFFVLAVFVLVPEMEMDSVFEGTGAVALIGIGILATPASIIAGLMVMKYRLGLVARDAPLTKKCPEYQTGNLIKFAIMEAAGLFAVVAYILTHNTVMLGAALIMIMVMVLSFPTRDRVINALSLDQDEIALLDDPIAVVSRG